MKTASRTDPPETVNGVITMQVISAMEPRNRPVVFRIRPLLLAEVGEDSVERTSSTGNGSGLMTHCKCDGPRMPTETGPALASMQGGFRLVTHVSAKDATKVEWAV